MSRRGHGGGRHGGSRAGGGGGGGGGKKNEPCKFFLTPQGCRKGDRCDFLHTGGSANPFAALAGGGGGGGGGNRQNRGGGGGGGGGGGAGGGAGNRAQIIRTIEEDFKALPLWPFSCYTYDKGVETIMPGDLSFEELRLMAYTQYKTHNTFAHVKKMEDDTGREYMERRRKLLSDPFCLVNQRDTMTMSMAGAPASSSIFGSTAPVSGFGAAPAPSGGFSSLLGGTSSAAPPASGLFGSASGAGSGGGGLFSSLAGGAAPSTGFMSTPAATNAAPLFGGMGQTPTSGFPTPTSGGGGFPGMMGGAPAAGGGPLFGGSSSTSTSAPFGGAAAPSGLGALFGGATASTAGPAGGGGLFGGISAPSSNIFGSGAPASSSATLFGGSAPTTGPTAAPPPSSTAGADQDDMAAFQAPQFTPGRIPELPPPPALCM